MVPFYSRLIYKKWSFNLSPTPMIVKCLPLFKRFLLFTKQGHSKYRGLTH